MNAGDSKGRRSTTALEPEPDGSEGTRNRTDQGQKKVSSHLSQQRSIRLVRTAPIPVPLVSRQTNSVVLAYGIMFCLRTIFETGSDAASLLGALLSASEICGEIDGACFALPACVSSWKVGTGG